MKIETVIILGLVVFFVHIAPHTTITNNYSNLELGDTLYNSKPDRGKVSWSVYNHTLLSHIDTNNIPDKLHPEEM
jgi:hypothetical protein